MKNWKTTLTGASALLAVIAHVVTVGHLEFATDVPAILAAVGLIAAKDHNQ